jgi:hypothetical protein
MKKVVIVVLALIAAAGVAFFGLGLWLVCHMPHGGCSF